MAETYWLLLDRLGHSSHLGFLRMVTGGRLRALDIESGPVRAGCGQEPKEPSLQVYDPDEAVAHARPLPPKELLALRDVLDDEWAAFQSVLA